MTTPVVVITHNRNPEKKARLDAWIDRYKPAQPAPAVARERQTTKKAV